MKIVLYNNKLFFRSNSWNNLAFGPEHAESLNEGTYVTNMIVPALQASLKNLPYGKTCYITTYVGYIPYLLYTCTSHIPNLLYYTSITQTVMYKVSHISRNVKNN